MSIRVFFKYVDVLPLVALALFVIAVVGLCQLVVRSDRLLSVVAHPATLMLALIVLLVVVSVMYPMADSLKLQNRGSDQDDCVRVLVNHVFALRAPFGYGTFHDPCSTGPTEFFVYFPVQISTGYFVLVPSLSLLLGVWVLRQAVDLPAAVLLSLTQFSSVLFVQMAVIGSDLIIVGWLFAAAIVTSRKGLQTASVALTFVGAVSYALFAGSRLPLAMVTIASMVVLLVTCGSVAWRVAVPATLITMATYGGSYLIAPSSFTPGHLVRKSGRVVRDLAGDSLLPLAIAVGVLAAAVVIALALSQTRQFLGLHYFSMNATLILIPMAAAAIWDLRRRSGDLGSWEGLHYLYVAVPAVLVMVANWLRAESEVADVQ